jgi:uncharacterized phage-associated protein
MPSSASQVANFMLDKADKDGIRVSPMKLLKLVYIGYGWSLAVLNRKLFDEPILAWAHGPVIRSVYDEFKHYGKTPIMEHAIEFDLETGESYEPRFSAGDHDVQVVLGKVWDVYKHFTAWSLRNKTHEKGTPWSTVYREGERDIEIPDDLIKQHFKTKIRQYIDDARGGTSARAS